MNKQKILDAIERNVVVFDGESYSYISRRLIALMNCYMLEKYSTFPVCFYLDSKDLCNNEDFKSIPIKAPDVNITEIYIQNECSFLPNYSKIFIGEFDNGMYMLGMY